MQTSQNFRNHTRLDPPFHFFVMPVLLINVFFTVAVLIHHWRDRVFLHAWLVLVALALLLTAALARMYATKAQDRVIRLEEKLRYLQLFTPQEAAAAQALSMRQIIALRFASDAELPALLQRTLAENLQPKAIKGAVTVWRSDTDRV